MPNPLSHRSLVARARCSSAPSHLVNPTADPKCLCVEVSCVRVRNNGEPRELDLLELRVDPLALCHHGPASGSLGVDRLPKLLNKDLALPPPYHVLKDLLCLLRKLLFYRLSSRHELGHRAPRILGFEALLSSRCRSVWGIDGRCRRYGELLQPCLLLCHQHFTSRYRTRNRVLESSRGFWPVLKPVALRGLVRLQENNCGDGEGRSCAEQDMRELHWQYPQVKLIFTQSAPVAGPGAQTLIVERRWGSQSKSTTRDPCWSEQVPPPWAQEVSQTTFQRQLPQNPVHGTPEIISL